MLKPVNRPLLLVILASVQDRFRRLTIDFAFRVVPRSFRVMRYPWRCAWHDGSHSYTCILARRHSTKQRLCVRNNPLRPAPAMAIESVSDKLNTSI